MWELCHPRAIYVPPRSHRSKVVREGEREDNCHHGILPMGPFRARLVVWEHRWVVRIVQKGFQDMGGRQCTMISHQSIEVTVDPPCPN